LCTACDHSGLSSQFRKPASAAAEWLNKVDASGTTAELEQADGAIAEAKAASRTQQDVQLADALDWYSILLHRRDRERTKRWRQICAREVELYFAGQPEGYKRISGEDVHVLRGSCQDVALQMLREDCLQSGHPSECTLPADAGR
jgi:hypothetical protein